MALQGGRFIAACAILALGAVCLNASALCSPARAAEIAVPPGFQVDSPIGGLDSPTAVDFSADGRIFVAEQSGRIFTFDGAGDTSPTLFASFARRVFGGGDRGLLSIELHPDFPSNRGVYVLYTQDALIGGTPPLRNDACPPDPNGCVVSGRVARLQENPSTGRALESDGLPVETWSLTGWCQQFISHSIGDLAFAPDGSLLVSGGEGANFDSADKGQFTLPGGAQACGDPPNEGGALRSQDLLTGGDPAGFSGTVIRLNAATGEARSGNPLFASPDPAARAIIAHGLRNPFRIEFRPGTSDLYIGDVGWNRLDEINRIPAVPPPSVHNFGWPCYAGTRRETPYDRLDAPLCEGLYTQFGDSGPGPPIFTVGRASDVFGGDPCREGFGLALSGLEFYDHPAEGGFPGSPYDGALLFADAARGCVWAAPPGEGGLPNFAAVSSLAARVSDNSAEFNPVDVVMSPDGAVYLPDFYGASIARIRYFPGNVPPVASFTAAPRYGAYPLTVNFDASQTTDSDGDSLTYSWDLNGDAIFGDAFGPTVSRTYGPAFENVTVTLRVSDPSGAVDVADTLIHAGDVAPPDVRILSPAPGTKFAPGEEVVLRGEALDPEDPAADASGRLPGQGLRWEVTVEHCPDDCHVHPLYTFRGPEATFTTPVHERPSRLVVRLTAADSRRLAGSVTARFGLVERTTPPLPRRVRLTVVSRPRGAPLTLGGTFGRGAVSRRFKRGARPLIAAKRKVRIGGRAYRFHHWSDGGKRAHRVRARRSMRLTAYYRRTIQRG